MKMRTKNGTYGERYTKLVIELVFARIGVCAI